MPAASKSQHQQHAILLIEDDPGAGTALQKVMGSEGYRVHLSLTAESALQTLQHDARAFHLVITDLKLPGMDGLELVKRLHQLIPQIPIILMTAHGTTETAIEAMKQGAVDYVTKPFEVEDLLKLVKTSLSQASHTDDFLAPSNPLSSPTGLIGQSRAMQSVYKEIGRIAPTDASILIRGASGSGKELIAHTLHKHSTRAHKPFVALNCAAIPETLFESELFGHERGAFTGATHQRMGHIQLAHEGTLFLDEIGDLPLNAQSKLLRFLAEGSFCPVGGNQPIHVNVRILSATHRDLETAIQEKEFREDLFYRLSVLTLRVPPLDERREDIPALTQYFLHRFADELCIPEPRITQEALAELSKQSWPGNVRQLQNTVRRALLLARPFPISLNHLTQSLPQPSPKFNQDQSLHSHIQVLLDRAEKDGLDDVYWRLIHELEDILFPEAVQRAGGNQTKAARWLGITRLKLRESLTAAAAKNIPTE